MPSPGPVTWFLALGGTTVQMLFEPGFGTWSFLFVALSFWYVMETIADD